MEVLVPSDLKNGARSMVPDFFRWAASLPLGPFRIQHSKVQFVEQKSGH